MLVSFGVGGCRSAGESKSGGERHGAGRVGRVGAVGDYGTAAPWKRIVRDV
jgi:hypothetical protein